MSKISWILSLLLAQRSHGQTEDCSGTSKNFRVQSEDGQCMWENNRGDTKTYPTDFGDILNKVEIYTCQDSGKRVIISNAIPDHDVTLYNNNAICEKFYVIEMPLNPVVNNDGPTEIPIRGMVAMATNGVPAYGTQESDGYNAVEQGEVTKEGAQYWYGHAGGDDTWHTHNPQMGEAEVTSDLLLGYAMDGFPIYGFLSDAEAANLDDCNGITVNGQYQYHVRHLDQVDETLEYCNGDSPVTNWNYILGCYSGSVQDTKLYDIATYTIPTDCVLEDAPPTPQPTTGPTTIKPTFPPVDNTKMPNVIIMQPDDLKFLDPWTPPPNNPSQQNQQQPFPDNDGNGLPNIERLRMDGVQMMQAYTGSPVCGTSRYSTITGKMPSRAASVRKKASESGEAPEITIPNTKLEDVDGQNDCTEENLAVAFKTAGYTTAMIGKWHLSKIGKNDYNHDDATETVKECGFDAVEALYVENLANGEDVEFNSYSDGTFSHNMEWLTYEAIKFINETTQADEPFFMYFNPTVPHGNNDVREALVNFDCQATSDPEYQWPNDEDPWIKGMSEDGGCDAYRQTILDRAETDDDLGSIWLDDSVGALLHALEDNGVLESTIFLFQEDHGMETKGALYENGVRIPQFIHYPNVIPAGSVFHGLVSTVDIAATMLDFASITPSYEMDGRSWKNAIMDEIEEDEWKNNRCLFFEVDHDRAARCGCYKYMDIVEGSTTYSRGGQKGLNNDVGGVLFDLCDDEGEYVTDNNDNREVDAMTDNADKLSALMEALNCHLERTDPLGTPDFTACAASDANPTAAPMTPAPTPIPTSAPSMPPSTSAPSTCEDSPLKIKKKNRTCADVLSLGKCSNKAFWTHCRSTCEKCNKCEDSKQKFKTNGKVKLITGDKTKKKNKIKCKNVKQADNTDELCQINDIALTCAKTCGVCPEAAAATIIV